MITGHLLLKPLGASGILAMLGPKESPVHWKTLAPVDLTGVHDDRTSRFGDHDQQTKFPFACRRIWINDVRRAINFVVL